MMKPTIAKFLRDKSGSTAIEYGIIAAMIVLVIMGSIALVGTNLNTLYFQKLVDALT